MKLSNLVLPALLMFAAIPFSSAAEPETLVRVEVIVLSVRGEQASKVEASLSKVDAQKLDLEKLFELVCASAGKERVNILSRPQMMMVDGQSGSFVVGEEKKFVTGMTVVADNGTAKFIPKEEVARTGIEFHCTPTAAADRKSVKLDMNFAQTTVGETIPVVPVTTLIAPVFEGGSQGKPVPFTQFIQQPKLDVVACEKSVTLQPGTGTLVKIGTREVESRTEFGLPILSKVPYVNRLFKNVAIVKEPETTFMCIQAKVMTDDDILAPLPNVKALPQPLPPCALVRASATAPVAEGKHAAILKILVEQYHAACKAGDTAKARTIAAHCLELDPTCFAK